jgi:hypothetical protein
VIFEVGSGGSNSGDGGTGGMEGLERPGLDEEEVEEREAGEVQDQTGSDRQRWERWMGQEEWGPRRHNAEERNGMRLEREAEEGALLEALR